MKRLALVLVLVAAAGCQDSGDTAEPVEPVATPQVTESSTPTAEPSPEVVTARVPDVEGSTLRNARKALERAGLIVQVTEELSHRREGSVLSQSLSAGERVPEGESISLVIAEAFPVIPNVVGDRLEQARRTLTARGFEVRVTRQESSQPKDTVLTQTPVGGTDARPGRVVTIVVAKPAPPPETNCASGYSPCLPLGPSDYDCSGGSGNGPAYTQPGVTYTVTGSDPYGLDSDNDGLGCE